MIYALRKLIAFVFLGGMFWLIYQDLGNLGKPWFMHVLGLIAVVFAFFWLLIPMVVVWFRIRRRRRQNFERHAQWLAEGGIVAVRPRPAGGKAAHLASIGPGESIYFHEKGTLYTDFTATGFDSSRHLSSPLGRPSDVAFPGFRRKCHVDQRTHCYFTKHGIAFAGKDLDFSIPFAELKSFSEEPGGIVFETDRGPFAARFAFTFRNPLIAADILRFLLKEES